MSKSLLDLFGSLDQSTKDVLADTTTPRTLAFLALYIAKRRFSTDSMSAEHIVACLESAGVGVTRVSIGRALAGAKGFVTRSINDDGEVFYRLMTRGAREAETILNDGGGLAILKIESGLPRQARLRLGELLGSLNGVIRICDPYYGVSTFDSLDLVPQRCKMRFLTQKTTEVARRVTGALRDFKRERPTAEFRLFPPAAQLHDRYIVTNKELLILGHGLKDIGNKESFVIRLDKTLIPDIVAGTCSSFDSYWRSGRTL